MKLSSRVVTLMAMAVLLGNSWTTRCQTPPAFPLVGVVQDPSGAILRHAALDLVNAASTATRSTTTDDAGRFRFDGVTGGTYELRVQAEGFAPASVRVRITSRAPSPLKIVLSLASFAQEITVRNSDTLTTAAADNRDAIVLNTDTLQNLPIFDQDLVGAASRFLDVGALGAGGVTLIVDGMEATSVGVSASAIQQIKINQDPYSAESARPGRGRIEIVTKAGAQDFHSDANFTFRDSRANSRDPFALTKAPEQRRIYEGSASGPLIDGKTTSFVVSGDRREEDVQAVVFAFGPSGAVRANVPQPARSVQLSASMNHQRGKNNTMFLRYTHEAVSTHNQGVGGTTLPEAASNTRSWENQVVYGHQTIVTKKLLHQLRVTLGEEGGSTTSLSAVPRVVVLDAFSAGGGQNDRATSQHRIGVADTLTYASGAQVIKAGLNIPEWNRRRNNDFSNTGGTFTFSTVDDYVAGRPLSFVQQRGDGRLTYLEKNLALFVQDQIQARPDLSVSLGLRYAWQNHIPDRNNLAPRASFAFAPGRRRGTVFRGGAGVFYDRLEGGAVGDFLRSAEGRLVRYVVLNPSYPDPFAGQGTNASPPPSIVVLAPHATLPYTVQYSAGVEQQVRKSTTIAVNYVGSRGVSLFRSRDVNAPPPPLYAARPDPNYGVVRQIESTARQRTDSIQFTLRGRVTRFFDGSVQYVLASAKNDTGGISALPANSYDLGSEWGRADFDQRHRFDLLGRIAIGKLTNFGVSLSLYSGRPYSLRTGRDNFNSGQSNARPAGVGRNTLTGPGYADLDLRWSRDIAPATRSKKEGPAVNVGVDAFNVLNRVNYSGYVGTLTSPFFGRAISAQPPRRLQLSLRFKF
jgi:outer membrane receptor protein involved in Fe transport